MNKITIKFEADRPLTTDEQDCIIAAIDNALNEPQTFVYSTNGETIDYVDADWQLKSLMIKTKWEEKQG